MTKKKTKSNQVWKILKFKILIRKNLKLWMISRNFWWNGSRNFRFTTLRTDEISVKEKYSIIGKSRRTLGDKFRFRKSTWKTKSESGKTQLISYYKIPGTSFEEIRPTLKKEGDDFQTFPLQNLTKFPIYNLMKQLHEIPYKKTN